MKKFTLSLLSGLFLITAQTAFSQTMSNTGKTITLDNTCFNVGVTSGTYTLDLSYFDLDNNVTATVSVTCTVSSNGTDHMVITVDNDIFPTPETNGYWDLADTYLGTIRLTAGSTSFFTVYFLEDEDGSLGFNCTPLGFNASNESVDNTLMTL